jgi:molecular chaperone GrpE
MGRKRQDQQEQAELEEQEVSGEPAAPVEEAGDPAPDTQPAEVNEEASRIQALEQEVAEWKDRCLRQAAEMENLRHRTRREAEEARRFANERLVLDLLPVLDNFGRALEAAEQTDNVEAFRSGVEQILRQLSDVLDRAGVTRIEAVGQPFDPNQHEAIMQSPAEDGQEPGMVVEELRAGYRLHERVVRPTLVKVTT